MTTTIDDTTTLQSKMDGRVARFADRREDWTVFGFETEKNPKFARAQRRYIGASGSVDPNDRRGGLLPSAFTMSVQSMPAGNRIPVHRHETEETFFILGGSCLVRCFDGDAVAEIRLGTWDLVACPPSIYHEIINDGDETCHVQTLLSKTTPQRPDYKDPELLELQAKIA
jgi:quercetin dioxygenase-like cupin family protein